ncbi:MAG TPA: hypothetical protein VFD91_10110 [Mariniphaga sp.]|nr:hypothetical protein [Mariniphaga sp.]
MPTKKLNHLKQHEIDIDKWNYCIGNASNSRVYATSWYLDRTAEFWEALVWEDYGYVMPLPVGKKWGIKYIYQPYFCQQLGIFPSPPVDIQRKFADELIKKYNYLEFQVNPQTIPEAFTSFEAGNRVNYVLPLHDPYATLTAQFKSNARNHISNSYKKGLRIVNTLDSMKYVELKRQHTEKSVDSRSFKILTKLISWSLSNSIGQIIAAISPQNEICGAAFFLKYGTRLIYLNSFSTPEGRKYKAMYAILNEVIKRYAGSGLLFDFEGSSVESIATFFRSFNPAEEQFHSLYLNNLPFPLKYFKRKKT